MFAQADEDEKNSLLYKVSRKVYNGELIPPESGNFVSDQNLFNYQAKVLKELSERESYVVVGRCADYILRERDDVLNVFIHADMASKINRAVMYFGITEDQAPALLKKKDKARSNHYKYYTDQDWGMASNYDLSLNSGALGIDGCVDVILKALEEIK